MLGCFLKTVPAGKCRECLDGPHYRHDTNRESEMCLVERSVDRASGLFIPCPSPKTWHELAEAEVKSPWCQNS